MHPKFYATILLNWARALSKDAEASLTADCAVLAVFRISLNWNSTTSDLAVFAKLLAWLTAFCNRV